MCKTEMKHPRVPFSNALCLYWPCSSAPLAVSPVRRRRLVETRRWIRFHRHLWVVSTTEPPQRLGRVARNSASLKQTRKTIISSLKEGGGLVNDGSMPGAIWRGSIVDEYSRNPSQSLKTNSQKYYTLVAQHFDCLQNALRVDTRLVVVHFLSNDVANSRGAAANCAGCSVQSVRIPFLESQHALVHIVQDVVL